MAAQIGELLTVPIILYGEEGGTATNVTTAAQGSGTQDGYGFPLLTALAASGEHPIPRYNLACYDDVNVRHYWVDTSISLTNAPNGFTYVPATLVVRGRF